MIVFGSGFAALPEYDPFILYQITFKPNLLIWKLKFEKSIKKKYNIFVKWEKEMKEVKF